MKVCHPDDRCDVTLRPRILTGGCTRRAWLPLISLTHTCQRTGRVWAMLCNKWRGSDVVGAAPRAIVEKPHEGFWVLKDKPRSAGRKSVMRGENSFSPPPLPISFWTSPAPLPRSRLSPKSLFCVHFSSASFCTWPNQLRRRLRWVG